MVKEMNFGADVLDDLDFYWSQPKTRRLSTAFNLMRQYYNGKTLESIGANKELGLTRERVRQIINYGVQNIRQSEKKVKLNDLKSIDSSPSPYARVYSYFLLFLKEEKRQFVSLDLFLNNDYFKSLKSHKRGLISLLNDVGIRQILYRNQYYLYQKSDNYTKEELIKEIQGFNREQRHERTLKKMMQMSKTVTWIPNAVRQSLSRISEKLKVKLGGIYELAIEEFKKANLYDLQNGKNSRSQVCDYFDVLMKDYNNNGTATETQVGVYISREVANIARTEADLCGISFMSFLRAAFVWFSNLSEQQQLVLVNQKGLLA